MVLIVQLDEETARLESAFEVRLRSIPGPYSEISEDLLGRFGIRPTERRTWTARLAPLTLLYPLLQTEGFSQMEQRLPRDATVAHLFLLIHTFLCDRSLDGQLTLSHRETAFMNQMRIEGLTLLNELGIGHKRRLEQILNRWTPARLAPCLPHESKIAGQAGWAKEVATASASLGVLSTVALAEYRGCDARTLRVIANAFDCLVTGLQWTDDMDDWREDLELGDQNFLLTSLRIRGAKSDGRAAAVNREAQVADSLCSNHVFELASDQARRWFGLALRRQRALRCVTLSTLIEERIEKLEFLEGQALAAAHGVIAQGASKTSITSPADSAPKIQ